MVGIPKESIGSFSLMRRGALHFRPKGFLSVKHVSLATGDVSSSSVASHEGAGTHITTCAWMDCSEAVLIDIEDKSGLKVFQPLGVGYEKAVMGYALQSCE